MISKQKEGNENMSKIKKRENKKEMKEMRDLMITEEKRVMRDITNDLADTRDRQMKELKAEVKLELEG